MKPLFARKDDPIKERHLIANQDISKDELIFVERPLLSLQSIGNAHQGALCCRCCRSFVGGPDLAISVASGKINRENIWDFHRENKQDLTSCCDIDIDIDIAIAREDNYRMVPCRNGCGEIFCSQDCEEEMWSCGGHDLLCTGLIPEPESQSSSAQANENADFCDQLHPLLQFKVFAVQNNEIFIMVADLIAAVVSIRRQQIAFNRKNQASSVEANSEVMLKELLAPYLDFTLVPWWEVATAPLISDPMKMVECIDLNRILKELCSTAAKLLFDAFSNIDGDDEFKETLEISMKESQEEYGLFTEDFFGKIIGSFEQNAMGLRSRNPLCRDILEDTELRKRRHVELVKCIELAGMIGDESGEHGEEEDVDMDSNENSDGNGDIGSSEHQNSAGAEEKKYETQRDCDDMYSIDDIAEFISGLDIDEEGLSTSTKVDGESHGDEEEDGGGDDLDNLFTPLDGTCMYSTACKMNHSCEPNVVARYNYSCASGGHLARWGKDFPLVLQCVALKHIKEGEELCISYIKSDAPLQERQAILSNYGFCCECTKCTREKGTLEIQHEGEQQQLNDDLFGEEDLFGDEDEDELFGGPEEVENDTEDDCVGAALLIERVKNLNRSEIASTAGSVPISILAPAFSFVNQMGTQILQELDSSRNDEAPVMEMIKATLKSLRERDIIEIKKIAREGETLTLSLLHKFGGWPSSSLREAHGCFCVVSSICHAEDGNFLPAIRFLDKAAVFGLPRGRLDGFFKYVESHVSRIACSHTAAFKIPNVVVGDYRSPELQQEVISRGLDASILNPITEIGAKEMSSDYSLGNQQIVIRNYAAEWPAIHKWRHLRYFSQNHGVRLVPIEHGIMSEKAGMKEELMTIQSFVRNHLAKSASQSVYSLGPTEGDTERVAYLAQHQLFEQIEDLKNDVINPTECGKSGPSHVNAWIGTGGTRTPLHFDSYDNLFVQVVGSKYIRLYDKSETSKLYVIKGNDNSYSRQGNMSAVDCEKENYSIHPQAESAKYTEVILFPGDAVYIPAKTWHYVRGLSTSASVNFWW